MAGNTNVRFKYGVLAQDDDASTPTIMPASLVKDFGTCRSFPNEVHCGLLIVYSVLLLHTF